MLIPQTSFSNEAMSHSFERDISRKGSSLRCEGNVKTDIREMACEHGKLIEVDLDRGSGTFL
jgi:hypothetical protein